MSEDEGAACTDGVAVGYEGTAVEFEGNTIVGALEPVPVPVVPGLYGTIYSAPVFELPPPVPELPLLRLFS